MKNRLQTALLAALLVPSTLITGCGEEPQQQAQIPQDIYIDVRIPAPTIINREIYVPGPDGGRCSNPQSPETTGEQVVVVPPPVGPAEPTDTTTTPAVVNPPPIAPNPVLAATPSVGGTPTTSDTAPATQTGPATQMPLATLGS